jgi:hypothetical protein
MVGKRAISLHDEKKNQCNRHIWPTFGTAVSNQSQITHLFHKLSSPIFVLWFVYIGSLLFGCIVPLFDERIGVKKL